MEKIKKCPVCGHSYPIEEFKDGICWDCLWELKDDPINNIPYNGESDPCESCGELKDPKICSKCNFS